MISNLMGRRVYDLLCSYHQKLWLTMAGMPLAPRYKALAEMKLDTKDVFRQVEEVIRRDLRSYEVHVWEATHCFACLYSSLVAGKSHDYCFACPLKSGPCRNLKSYYQKYEATITAIKQIQESDRYKGTHQTAALVLMLSELCDKIAVDWPTQSENHHWDD